MIDIALDQNNKDLSLSGYDLKLTSNDIEYYSQKIEIVLSTFKGEWWLNDEIGMPWFTDILTKNPNIPLIDNIIKTEILAIDGVSKIIEYKNNYDNQLRTMTVSLKVELTSGELVEVGAFNVI